MVAYAVGLALKIEKEAREVFAQAIKEEIRSRDLSDPQEIEDLVDQVLARYEEKEDEL